MIYRRLGHRAEAQQQQADPQPGRGSGGGRTSIPKPESPQAACRLARSEARAVLAPQPETERTAPHCRADSEPLDHQGSPSF